MSIFDIAAILIGLAALFGLDIRRPAIKLPGIGRVGFPQS